MPRDFHSDYFRNELFIWILFDGFEETGYVDQREIDKVTTRYLRELKSRGIELSGMYADCVSERYDDVYQAGVRAIEYGILSKHQSRLGYQIIGSVEPFLRKPREGEPILSDEEIRLAKEAAGIAYAAWADRCLDGDLKKEEDQTAATP